MLVTITEACGAAHKSCVTYFNSSRSYERYELLFGKTIPESLNNDEVGAGESTATTCYDTRAKASSTHKVICFICDTVRVGDYDKNIGYNKGGLGRCGFQDTSDKLNIRQETFLKLPDHPLHAAAKRLQLLRSGHGLDMFAIDIYYHQSCYIKFSLKPISHADHAKQEVAAKQKDAIEKFCFDLKISIVRNHNAHLLLTTMTPM